MKSYISIIIIEIFFASCGFPQTSLESNFKTYISYFDFNKPKDKIFNDGIQIPLHVARSVLGDKIDERIMDIHSIFGLKKDSCFVTLIDGFYPEGGLSNVYYLFLFSSNGTLLNDYWLGFNSLDEGGGQSCNLSFTNDTILEVDNSNLEIKEDGTHIYSKREFSYYLLGKHVIDEIHIFSPSPGRSFPEASLRILNDTDLVNKSTIELTLIVNEVYAEHEYIFSDPDLRKYFSAKDWYHPSLYNVIDKLNPIEKINVININKRTSEMRLH